MTTVFSWSKLITVHSNRHFRVLLTKDSNSRAWSIHPMPEKSANPASGGQICWKVSTISSQSLSSGVTLKPKKSCLWGYQSWPSGLPLFQQAWRQTGSSCQMAGLASQKRDFYFVILRENHRYTEWFESEAALWASHDICGRKSASLCSTSHDRFLQTLACIVEASHKREKTSSLQKGFVLFSFPRHPEAQSNSFFEGGLLKKKRSCSFTTAPHFVEHCSQGCQASWDWNNFTLENEAKPTVH